jgi:hypothetical protein
LGVGASEKAKRASEGFAVIGPIVNCSSERPTRGDNEMRGCLSLGPSEADKGGEAGHRKEKEKGKDRGPWYVDENGMQRDLEQFSDF